MLQGFRDWAYARRKDASSPGGKLASFGELTGYTRVACSNREYPEGFSRKRISMELPAETEPSRTGRGSGAGPEASGPGADSKKPLLGDKGGTGRPGEAKASGLVPLEVLEHWLRAVCPGQEAAP